MYLLGVKITPMPTLASVFLFRSMPPFGGDPRYSTLSQPVPMSKNGAKVTIALFCLLRHTGTRNSSEPKTPLSRSNSFSR